MSYRRGYIGIASFYSSTHRDFGVMTALNHISYATKHGYCYYHAEWNVGTLEQYLQRPAAWEKLRMWQAFLPYHEWLLWIDADAVFVDMERKLEHFLSPTHDIVIPADVNGINTGVFLLRNCEWTHNFLHRVWHEAEDVNHGWWEQKSMGDLLKNNPEDAKHVDIIVNSVMNDQVITGSTFIAHCGGSAPKYGFIQHALSQVRG